MKNKSNTQAIIEIWIKACFEKLMKAKTPNAAVNPTLPSKPARAETDSDSSIPKLSPKTRQDT